MGNKIVRGRRWMALALLAIGLFADVPAASTQPNPTANPPFISAIWYTSDDPGHYASPLVPGDLQFLKSRLCPSHILVKVFVAQAEKASVDPKTDPRFTAPDDTLRQLISAVHRAGMGVVLLPVLFVEDGTWEGDILPANLDQWFASWEALLLHYANLMEETGGEILLLGSELVTLRDHHDYWLRLIEKVRQHYAGLLSYSANWWYDSNFYRSILEMKQWEALDYIGVTAYFEMTDQQDPTVDELEGAWRRNRHRRNVLADLESMSIRYGNKPVVFWEFGYQSKNGANIEPWNFFLDAESDPQEQADAFEAYFNAFSPMPWWRGQGVFAEQVGLPIDIFGYSILDKPAETVIAQHACAQKSP